MKTHNIKLIAAIALCITLTGIRAHASDFKTIYKYLDRNPSKETIGGLMKSLSPEGAFVTLNYRATDGSPRKHVQNLITLACAYQHPENTFYHDKTLKESYLKALRFWIDTNHQAKNWWYRYIPYPKELSTSVVLMSREINENPELFDKTIKYRPLTHDRSQRRRHHHGVICRQHPDRERKPDGRLQRTDDATAHHTTLRRHTT